MSSTGSTGRNSIFYDTKRHGTPLRVQGGRRAKRNTPDGRRRVTRTALACGGMVLLLSTPSPAAPAGDRRLVEAVKNRDTAAARLLVGPHVDVNTALPDGASAIHWAVLLDDTETVELLIRSGARVNVTDDYGVAPLLLACENGSRPIVEMLLNAGANPNVALPTGETAIMTAARTGKVDAVKALLAHGADVNGKENTRGQTALMWAAAEKHADVARLLIHAGADVHARSTAGFTPLLFAAREADVEMTDVLLSAGANINEAALDGSTSLLTAVIRRHVDYAQLLLDKGADPNAGSGYTPLHWAAGEWNGELSVSVPADSEWGAFGGLRGPEKVEFVKVLLAHGADPNARVTRNVRRFGGGGGNAGSLIGATPFLLAAMARDVAVMRVLLAAGADPRITTNSNTTALMLAAGLGHAPGITPVPETDAFEAVKLTLELGADVNAANSAGETALHAAAYWGADSVVQFLLDQGANVNVRDRKLWTPLVITEGIYQGGGVKYFPTTAELLRRRGAEPSPPNIDRANGGLTGPDPRR
jgi:ankyrin repeat protein